MTMIKTSQSYANDDSFHWYVKYLAMKKHFTTDGYDFATTYNVMKSITPMEIQSIINTPKK